MHHRLKINIYYEDTDCAGVVYYANYLKYFERARTELLRSLGIPVRDLMDEGLYFVVVKASLDYHRPGRYGDTLLIETEVTHIGSASIEFSHYVRNDLTGDMLVSGMVKIATVTDRLKPVRLPAKIKESFENAPGIT